MTISKDQLIPVHRIITHVHPDLDALLAIYMLRKHGENLFPGVKDAPVDYVSANYLPSGKTPEDLENEGILAVDTGGGRFDNHPNASTMNQKKWDSCAAQLVADTFGVAEDSGYRIILPFTLAHDSEGRSLSSKDAAHHLLAPHGILEGLHRLYEDDGKVTDIFQEYLEALYFIHSREEYDIDAVAEQFDSALLNYLQENYKTDNDFERKEAFSWPTLGSSHTFVQSKGWNFRRDIEKLMKFTSNLLTKNDRQLPDEENETQLLLPFIIKGLAELHQSDLTRFHELTAIFFDAVVKREADWFSALNDVNRSARVIKGRKFNLIAVASKNGLVIKAARYKKRADAVLYYDPQNKFVTVQAGRRPDGKSVLNLPRVAARLRIADRVKRGNQKPLNNADGIGEVAGWFLHQSLQVLNRGSQKAPDATQTSLDYDELIQIVASEIHYQEKLPDQFCPPDQCLEKKCAFYSLKLSNCYNHRQNIRNIPKKGTLGDLFGDKLNSIK